MHINCLLVIRCLYIYDLQDSVLLLCEPRNHSKLAIHGTLQTVISAPKLQVSNVLPLIDHAIKHV